VPPEIPPLPPRLADPTPTVLICTGLWLLASLVLFGAFVFGDRALDEWFWTATAGWLLGLLGYSIFRWQRSAARRGSRSAQRGLGAR
jgi:hypothetical protein